MSRLNAIALCAAAAALSLAAASCIKEKDSLVIVSMTADMEIPGPIQVRVSVGPVTQTFDLATGLSVATPTQRGIYLDSKTTGTQVVSAGTQGGAPCLTYAAVPQQTVAIGSAGETKMVLLVLVHAGACGSNSDAGGGAGGTVTDAGGDSPGAGGSPGMGGRGGAAGTGAGGTGVGGAGGAVIVAPPSLSRCVEIHHTDITCDTSTGAGDPLVFSVAFSPDGKLLLTAGDDGRIRFWKIGTGAAAPTVDGRELTVSGQGYLAFSHNGQYLAAGDDSGMVTVWTMSSSPTIYAVFNGHGGQLIDSVWFSPDDTRLVSVADDDRLIVWSMASRASVATISLTTFPWWVRTSPLATASALPLVVTQNDGNFVLMNALAAAPVAKVTTMVSNNIDTSHQVAEGVSYAPDGRSLLLGRLLFLRVLFVLALFVSHYEWTSICLGFCASCGCSGPA